MRTANDIKVPSTRSLTVFCLVLALAFGVMTAYSLESPTLFSIVGIAFTFIAIGGALLFVSLSRASAQMRVAVEEANEALLAEGIGRLSGKLTGLVVAATTAGIVSAPARLVRKPVISVSIPYEDVLKFEASGDSLDVRGRHADIAITKCAPSQVAELARQLETRVHRVR